MMQVEYPIDYEKLQKGDVITAAVVHQITGLQPDDRKYGFAILKLCKEAEREMYERNKPATCRIVGSEIHVLSDAVALEHNADQFESGLRKARRSHRRLTWVDSQLLTDEEKKTLEQRLITQSKILVAIKRERRAIEGGKTPLPALTSE